MHHHLCVSTSSTSDPILLTASRQDRCFPWNALQGKVEIAMHGGRLCHNRGECRHNFRTETSSGLWEAHRQNEVIVEANVQKCFTELAA